MQENQQVVFEQTKPMWLSNKIDFTLPISIDECIIKITSPEIGLQSGDNTFKIIMSDNGSALFKLSRYKSHVIATGIIVPTNITTCHVSGVVGIDRKTTIRDIVICMILVIAALAYLSIEHHTDIARVIVAFAILFVPSFLIQYSSESKAINNILDKFYSLNFAYLYNWHSLKKSGTITSK